MPSNKLSKRFWSLQWTALDLAHFLASNLRLTLMGGI